MDSLSSDLSQLLASLAVAGPVERGLIAISVGCFIADRLRHHGYISDSDEPEIGWEGLRG